MSQYIQILLYQHAAISNLVGEFYILWSAKLLLGTRLAPKDDTTRLIGCANSVAGAPNNHTRVLLEAALSACVKFKSQQTLPQVTLAFIFLGKHESQRAAAYPFSPSQIGFQPTEKILSEAKNQRGKGTFCLFSTSALFASAGGPFYL